MKGTNKQPSSGVRLDEGGFPKGEGAPSAPELSDRGVPKGEVPMVEDAEEAAVVLRAREEDGARDLAQEVGMGRDDDTSGDIDDNTRCGRRSSSRPRQYELLPGLHATLDEDAVVATLDATGYGGNSSEGEVLGVHVTSNRVGLGRGSPFAGPEGSGSGVGGERSFAVIGRDVKLRATVDRRPDGALVARDLDVTVAGSASVDFGADDGAVLAFLREWAGRRTLDLPLGPLGAELRLSPVDGACYVAAKVGGVESPLEVGDVLESLNGTAPAGKGDGLRAWGALFRAAADGERTLVVRRTISGMRPTGEKQDKLLGDAEGNGRTTSEGDSTSPSPHVFPLAGDVWIPNARVGAFSLTYPGLEEPVQFPACEGTDSCTLRTMLEYYCAAVLRTVAARSREVDDEGGRAEVARPCVSAVADMASTRGSIVGASLGGAILGPAGFLAGSYLGGQLGKKHSAVVGGVAGACLFGPIGLVAGAAAGTAGREEPPAASRDAGGRSWMPSATFGASTHPERRPGNAVTDHLSNNRYEYAGTAGVVAGAAVGVIAGPVGMLAGAFAGSVAARGGTRLASDAAAETRRAEGREGSRFGDVRRGIVERGKKSRGADRGEGYKFGDFTRGLFSNE